jgi:hypothetical protein
MGNSKMVWVYEATTGRLIGEYLAQESPLEPGVFIAPTHSTDIEPPQTTEGMSAIFADGKWDAVVIVSAPDPEMTMARRKELKLDWVHTERDIRCTTDVIVYGRPWQADLRSQDLLNKAVVLALAGAPLPTAWRDSNNSDMPITSVEQLVVIGGAMAHQTELAYHRSWELKAAIWAATSEEELSMIEWETEPPS